MNLAIHILGFLVVSFGMYFGGIDVISETGPWIMVMVGVAIVYFNA